MADLLSKIKNVMKQQTPPQAPAPAKVVPFTPAKTQTDIDIIFSKPDSHEVEISFGTYKNGRFQPGVSKNVFKKIKDQLSKFSKPERTEDKVEIDEKLRIRKITGAKGDVIWQKKERDQRKIEGPNYRISSSKEVTLPKEPQNFKATRVRNRKRYSFLLKEYPNFRFDLTEVTSSSDGDSQSTFEIEIERVLRKSPTNIKWEQQVNDIIKFIGVESPSTPDPDSDLDFAIQEHNKLFANDRLITAGRLLSGYWNKPKNIKKDDILASHLFNFSATVKLDGVRAFILILKSSIYACFPPNNIELVRSDMKGIENLNLTLLDCEKITKPDGSVKYMVFDILFNRGTDVRYENFEDRLKYAKSAVKKLGISEVQMKRFYKGNFYEITRKCIEKIRSSDIETDGIIYQPSGPYRNKDTKKWKPVEKLTIDFKLKSLGNNKYQLNVAKYYNNVPKYIPFRGSFKNPVKGDETIVNISPSKKYKSEELEGSVAEFSYKENTFHLQKLRLDKAGIPNEEKVAGNVWDDIVDPISEDTITGKDLIIMRRLHNLCKDTLLQSNFRKGNSIMDWGSGRGGDLGKWNNIGLSKVFVVEPNGDNFAILNERWQDMNKKVNIVPIRDAKEKLAGGQDTDSLLNTLGSTKIDGLVSFFSLTFFGKDKKMFEQGIKSISSVLPSIGNKFVGIVMDGDRTKSLIKKEPFKSTGFDIIPISVEPDIEEPSKGKNEIDIKIHDPTSMVDQREWLFYFKKFQKQLEQEGFQLKTEGFLSDKDSDTLPSLRIYGKQMSFAELYDNIGDSAKTFSSLNRYFIFERVSATEIPSVKKESFKKEVFNLDMYEKEECSEFLEAVLLSFDTKYKKGNRKKRMKEVKRMMSNLLTIDQFKELSGGCLYKAEMVVAADEDEALENFKEYLLQDNLNYVKIVDYLTKLLKININVIGPVSTTKSNMYSNIHVYSKSIYIYVEDSKVYLLKINGRKIFKEKD